MMHALLFLGAATVATSLPTSLPAEVPLLGSAGYIHVGERQEKALFHWFFPCETNTTSAPVLLWLQGGPGASGTDGLFYENGPYDASDPDNIRLRNTSWTQFANLIFIDQPVGTGFSYSTEKTEDLKISTREQMKDVFEFLTKFFEMHPTLAKNPFFIFGESYGGHYAPALASLIVDLRNKNATTINLAGVGIGDGWVDPEIQYPAYVDFALNEKLISSEAHHSVMRLADHCVSDIHGRNWLAAGVSCNAVVGAILGLNPGMSFYDIRLICPKKRAWVHDCYNMTGGPHWMETPRLRNFLNISKSIQWHSREAVDSIVAAANGDEEMSFAADVALVLEAGVPVLVYNGDADFAANHLGAERWTSALPWNGQKGFNAASLKPWVVEGSTAGWVRSYKGFTYVKVKDAGHMVPMDQPAHALVLAANLVTGQSHETE